MARATWFATSAGRRPEWADFGGVGESRVARAPGPGAATPRTFGLTPLKTLLKTVSGAVWTDFSGKVGRPESPKPGSGAFHPPVLDAQTEFGVPVPA